MSDLRDYILSKLQEMVKAPKKKVKPFQPTDADRQDHMAHLDKQDAEREPSDKDAEIEQMAKDYGYGKKEESKIAFRKDTIHGQAARKTAAETLKHHKAKQQAKPGATPRAVAKEVKQFSKDTYKQRESTNLKDRMVEILMEEFRGTSHTSVAAKMHNDPKHDDLTSKQIGKKSRALASVVNKQPTVINNKKKAEAEYKEKMKQNRENPSRGNNVYTGGDSRGKTRSGSTFRHPVTGKDVEV